MSTNAYVDPCPECGADTCLNNRSTRPPYHSQECWTCGAWSHTEYNADGAITHEEFGWMTEEERLDFKQYMMGMQPKDEEE